MLPCPVAVRAQTNAVQEQKGAMALTLKHAETMIQIPATNGHPQLLEQETLTVLMDATLARDNAILL